MNRVLPILTLAVLHSLHIAVAHAQTFTLDKGDHICIIGNTLAERMQHHGHLETFITARFPQHELVFRNLGFSGDEIDAGKRLRSSAFGTPDQWLSGSAPIPQPNKLVTLENVLDNRFEFTNTKADVIFAFFGYNESFAGEAGLPDFKRLLDNWIKHTLNQKYNGKSAPRLVLFSPIAHEDLKNPDLPDGKENNARLKIYTAAMAEVAKANNITFVDLFAPTLAAFTRRTGSAFAPPVPFNTINGIHLNESGDRVVAEIIDKALFGARSGTEIRRLTAEEAFGGGPPVPENLRKAINDKNWFWFHRYRATDGFSTYGDRAFLTFKGGGNKRIITNKEGNKVESDILPANYETMQRELHQLDIMTANRDKAVWEIAQGRTPKIDDGNIPPAIDALTNKPGPGPGGAHLFLSGEETIQKMKLGKNLKIQLFASEKEFPAIVNPNQMAFDTRGRLWVTAWPTYPHWKPGTPMNDKLLILEDTDGDGKADKCIEFVSDIHNPTGFEFYNGGVIVACQPDIWFFKDTDGDDKADIRERILHGFDSADTHHAINSFVYDGGGGLYFQEGIFHRVQVETPWNRALRLVDGGVYRFEPRTFKVATYIPHSFPNPHGHIFDRWGQDFVTDGTGSTTCWGAPFSVHAEFPSKRGKPPAVYKQRTRPTPATEILSSRHFPEEMQGNFLIQNVIGVLGILQYKFSDKDSHYEGVEQEPFLLSTDQNFRPTDLEMGPDGALYFSDWHNPIIGHMQHNMRDNSRDKAHGRVYKITYEGRPLLTPKKIDGEPVDKLVALLAEHEDRVRYRVKIELSERKTDEVIAAVKKWTASLDKNDKEYEHHMLEALWVHQWHNVVNEELLNSLLAAKDFRARAAAVRVLQHWSDRVTNPLDTLAKLVKDESPRVRLEAVRACSFFRTKKAAEIALEAANLPMDKTLEYTLNETMKTLKPYK